MASLLSPSQVESFRADGYLVLDSFVSPEEVDRIQALVLPLFESQALAAEGMVIDYGGREDGPGRVLPQVLSPFDHQPSLRRTAFYERSFQLGAELLGGGVAQRGGHSFHKPSGSGETPWHQDEAFWDPAQEHHALSVWLPFQDITLENGCIDFLPGSHHLEVLPHRHIDGDEAVHGLELAAEGMDFTRARSCPVPKGGCTIHHCRTLHRARPNHSGAPRTALVVEVGRPPAPRAGPRSFPWQQTRTRAAAARRARGLHY